MSTKTGFNIVSAVILSMVLLSCGEEEHVAKDVGPFKTIYANGGVTFRFIQGASENRVVSTSIDDNHYQVNGDQLFVNTPRGVITVAISDLDWFWCNGCHIENSGPIVQDTLDIVMHAGSVELTDLQINVLKLNASNTGTYKLSGSATFFDVYAVNTSSILAFNLVTDSTHVDPGAVDCEVHATKVLQAYLGSTGNVYYMGDPPIVRTSGFGFGKAIKK